MHWAALLMRPLGALVGYGLLVFLGAMLVAYPVVFLASSLGYELGLEKALARAVVLMAVILVWPLARFCGIGAQALGLGRFQSRRWAAGILAGALITLPVIAVIMAVELRIIDVRVEFSGAWLARTLAVGVITGVVVGFIEESIFRGLLLTLMQRGANLVTGVIGSSFAYAMVHFLDVPDGAQTSAEGGPGAFGYLLIGFQSLATPADYWDSFLALFLLGVGLCWVRLRFDLYACMGIHAGFVLMVYLLKAVSVRIPAHDYDFLVGSYDHVTGVMVTAWLVILLAGSGLWIRMRSAEQEPIEKSTMRTQAE